MSTRLKSKISPTMRLFFMRHLFGLADENSKSIGRVVNHNRLVLSARYIRGNGIEIGGLGRPLQVNPGVNVQYVDRFSIEDLRENYPERASENLQEPDIVSNGETLEAVPDTSQDFVVANHVIEHFQNPILFFVNAYRVLKPGGTLFLTFPDKDKTFDRDRPVTDFSHLERDFSDGPEWSHQQHFEEFVALADIDDIGRPAWQGETERETLVKKLIEEDYSIHFHVWDTRAMMDLINNICEKYDLHFNFQQMLCSGDETIFILIKA